MEEHLKQRDDLEIQLAQAIQVGVDTFKKNSYFQRIILRLTRLCQRKKIVGA